jgi:hypothetical protein
LVLLVRLLLLLVQRLLVGRQVQLRGIQPKIFSRMQPWEAQRLELLKLFLVVDYLVVAVQVRRLELQQQAEFQVA